jgi:DNA-binding NtrC family response regulator
LSVSSQQEDHTALECILQQDRNAGRIAWNLSATSSFSSALRQLRSGKFAAVICERDLPVGDWRDLLEHASRFERAPYVIVASRHADERLWAEALNLGAYDVFRKPFDQLEVVRVLSLAWARWCEDGRGWGRRWA